MAMSLSLFLPLILLVAFTRLPCSEALHFRGGIIYWKPNPDSPLKVFVHLSHCIREFTHSRSRRNTSLRNNTLLLLLIVTHYHFHFYCYSPYNAATRKFRVLMYCVVFLICWMLTNWYPIVSPYNLAICSHIFSKAGLWFTVHRWFLRLEIGKERGTRTNC